MYAAASGSAADDRRFWELAEDAGKGAGIRTMSGALDRIEERGIEQGEEKMAKLVQLLLSMGRYEDVGRASRDKKEREKLFEEPAVRQHDAGTGEPLS